ncbi:hypothetical protein [Ottowia testudinis]|uniref:Uncharacterized protein n=1 Tax=Ottowia testudinis TaxID=2816950 RepID=A0A975CGD9_9BURK|nr:hypothetical protein [Ottowia testudinis]QTD45069.1 hypothetical protein J1M35_18900 [Ottowia testudinis]
MRRLKKTPLLLALALLLVWAAIALTRALPERQTASTVEVLPAEQTEGVTEVVLDAGPPEENWNPPIEVLFAPGPDVRIESPERDGAEDPRVQAVRKGTRLTLRRMAPPGQRSYRYTHWPKIILPLTVQRLQGYKLAVTVQEDQTLPSLAVQAHELNVQDGRLGSLDVASHAECRRPATSAGPCGQRTPDSGEVIIHARALERLRVESAGGLVALRSRTQMQHVHLASTPDTRLETRVNMLPRVQWTALDAAREADLRAPLQPCPFAQAPAAPASATASGGTCRRP